MVLSYLGLSFLLVQWQGWTKELPEPSQPRPFTLSDLISFPKIPLGSQPPLLAPPTFRWSQEALPIA